MSIDEMPTLIRLPLCPILKVQIGAIFRSGITEGNSFQRKGSRSRGQRTVDKQGSRHAQVAQKRFGSWCGYVLNSLENGPARVGATAGLPARHG